MKRKLLSVAVAVAAAAPLSTFAAGPTVYGKLNLSVEQESVEVESEDTDRWVVNSNASRFGVKGDVTLGGGAKGVYLAEWGFSPDTTSSSSSSSRNEFTSRNAYAGLSGEFGTFLLGRMDTFLRTSQGKVDVFNDYNNADLTNIFMGEVRSPNAIAYSTPLLSGLQGNLMLIPGEEFEDDDSSTDDKNGLADGMSASVTYNQNNIYLALGYDNEVSYSLDEDYALTSASERVSAFRLTAQATFGQLTGGFMYQSGESEDGIELEDDGDSFYLGELEQDGWLLSAKYAIDKRQAAKVQFGNTETEFSDVEDFTLESQQIALGYDYSLAETTMVYGFISQLTYESDDSDEETFMAIGGGIEQRF